MRENRHAVSDRSPEAIYGRNNRGKRKRPDPKPYGKRGAQGKSESDEGRRGISDVFLVVPGRLHIHVYHKPEIIIRRNNAIERADYR